MAKYTVGEHAFIVERSMRGDLQAESELPIPSKPSYVLVITTGKGTRGLRTSVQAMKVEAPSAAGFGSRSFVMFGDFSKSIPGAAARATEKAIATQHASVLEQADALLAECDAFYAAKAAKQEA